MKVWIYILRCVDDSYYIGSTKNLKRRIYEHEKGHCCHTSQRLPIELVYSEVFYSLYYAKKREIQLKGWNRKKKESLIKGDTKLLHELAKCINETSHLYRPSAPLRTGGAKTR